MSKATYPLKLPLSIKRAAERWLKKAEYRSISGSRLRWHKK
jgi:hypothetical protein